MATTHTTTTAASVLDVNTALRIVRSGTSDWDTTVAAAVLLRQTIREPRCSRQLASMCSRAIQSMKARDVHMHMAAMAQDHAAR